MADGIVSRKCVRPGAGNTQKVTDRGDQGETNLKVRTSTGREGERWKKEGVEL